MLCRRVRPLLPEYQLGGLGPRIRRAIEQHLATCGECSEELRAMEAADTQLFAAFEQETSPDLWARIESNLDERQTKRAFRWHYAWAPLGAAALAAAVWLVSTRDGVTPPEVAEAEFEVGYERQHALLGWNDPLADRIHLGVVGLEEAEDSAP